MIFADLFMNHGAEDAVRAADLLLTGPLRNSFWIFVVGLGGIVPIALILWPLRVRPILPVVLAGLGIRNLWIKRPSCSACGCMSELWIQSRPGLRAAELEKDLKNG